MKRKTLLIVASFLLALGIFAASFYFFMAGRRYQLVITQPELQQALSSKFPLSKTYLFIVDLTYHAPVIILEEGDGNRVKVGLSAISNVRLNGKHLEGHGALAGALRYEPREGAFYLDSVRAEDLGLGGLPDEYKARAEEFASSLLRDYFSKNPVYRLRDDDLKQKSAKLVMKSVRVQDQALVVTLGLGSSPK